MDTSSAKTSFSINDILTFPRQSGHLGSLSRPAAGEDSISLSATELENNSERVRRKAPVGGLPLPPAATLPSSTKNSTRISPNPAQNNHNANAPPHKVFPPLCAQMPPSSCFRVTPCAVAGSSSSQSATMASPVRPTFFAPTQPPIAVPPLLRRPTLVSGPTGGGGGTVSPHEAGLFTAAGHFALPCLPPLPGHQGFSAAALRGVMEAGLIPSCHYPPPPYLPAQPAPVNVFEALQAHYGLHPSLWSSLLDMKSGGRRKGGQIRFSNEQTQRLETTFEKSKYLTPQERKSIAKCLDLTERQMRRSISMEGCVSVSIREMEYYIASLTSSLGHPDANSHSAEEEIEDYEVEDEIVDVMDKSN